MRILVVTGDQTFKPGHPRFSLQSEAVEQLEVLYWGPGAFLPRVPSGSFDVVSVQDPFFRGLYGILLARSMKARLNVQVHADINAQSFLKRVIAGFVLRSADSIRVVSEKIKTYVLALGVRAPVSVLPIFVDVERFRGITRAPHSPPMILWVGRFVHEKDPLLAIRVFKEVLLRGASARLVMLGAGALEAQLKGAAKGLPIEFPGWHTDVTPYLARASVVLSTSHAESWGASIAEALAAGVPVVAPDVGIAREAGAVVAPRNDLSGAVLRVLSQGTKGALLIPSYSKGEWQNAWRNTLQ